MDGGGEGGGGRARDVDIDDTQGDRGVQILFNVYDMLCLNQHKYWLSRLEPSMPGDDCNRSLRTCPLID